MLIALSSIGSAPAFLLVKVKFSPLILTALSITFGGLLARDTILIGIFVAYEESESEYFTILLMSKILNNILFPLGEFGGRGP